MATISMSGKSLIAARNTMRPIRPNPLMPTLMVMRNLQQKTESMGMRNNPHRLDPQPKPPTRGHCLRESWRCRSACYVNTGAARSLPLPQVEIGILRGLDARRRYPPYCGGDAFDGEAEMLEQHARGR